MRFVHLLSYTRWNVLMSESSKIGQPENIRHDINYKNLVEKALKLRQQTFQAFVEHGEAHLGGSFSIIELLIALYEKVIKKEDMVDVLLIMVI